MVVHGSPAPGEVVDRLLWRNAQHMLGRHAEPGYDGRCAWCGWRWPCPARRLAERAEEVSLRPWGRSRTDRHGVRPAGWYAEAHARSNGGHFE
jgi:hypothetical protein